MWVGVLGPTVVAEDPAAGRVVPVQAAKHRALLAALALHGGRPASAEALVDVIWGRDAPATAAATLQTYVSVVRRTLEPELPARSPSSHLLSTDHGYALRAGTDVEEFARLVREVHASLGPLVTATVPTAERLDVAGHLATLDRALALWRGDPFADLPASDAVVPERVRLQELRLLALEDRATLLVALGRAEAISELESLTSTHPLRERPWTLLAVALARAGRQADALAALERLRTTLDEELGLDPGSAVRDLQTAILRQEVGPAEQTTPAARPELRVTLPDWPMVGREAHLAVLEGLLAKADAGLPRFAALIGEPGAGKTRLGAELALRAQQQGALLLVGRCSQEEDAPPLWPWTQALGPHVQEAITAAGDHDAARFAVAERIREELAGLARDRTVLLGLEDLHWADASSLRVLRHLCAHVQTGRLLVVGTWRPGEQTPALAETVAALARRHATLLELGGLSADETAELLGALTGHADPEVATAAHQRTEGNPFFLIEYGRLARDEHTELAGVLDAMPRTVADVVEQRIAQLPESAATALTAGAAIGRDFGVDLLAPALGVDELAALDLLEPALEVDLLQDLGGDRFRFGHALVRDAAYAGLSRSRRERLHARLAELVEAVPDAEARSSEIARHWAAAGPRHVRRAWQAALRAGEAAMAAHAADEAAREYAAGIALHAADPAGTTRERFDLLVRYAEACRWSTHRLEMHEAIDEAIVLAGELGEPELVVHAATAATADALWPARAYGEHNDAVIAVMRRALEQLDGDSPLRCRLLLALASESYYATSPAHLDALVEDAVAMARRLADPRLLMDALLGAAVATFRRGTAERCHAWLVEARGLAEAAGDQRSVTNVRALIAPLRCALGDVMGLLDEISDVARTARELKLYFVEMVTLNFAHSWAAMGGDPAETEAVFARLVDCFELVSTAHKVDTVQGAALYVPLWDPEAPTVDVELVMSYMAESSIPVGPAATVLALRQGQPELARRIFDEHGIDLVADNWFSPFIWALGAELGLRLGEPDVAAGAYDRLAPYAGTCVMSGTAPAFGPVDAYLALAAAATGETALATEHAEAALGLVRAWQLPQVERWLLDLREGYRF